MRTGKVVRYVVASDQLVLTLLLEDGTEVEGRVGLDSALALGDDIYHVAYIRADEEGQRIRKITRTLDSAGRILEHDDEIEYESEESKK